MYKLILSRLKIRDWIRVSQTLTGVSQCYTITDEGTELIDLAISILTKTTIPRGIYLDVTLISLTDIIMHL